MTTEPPSLPASELTILFVSFGSLDMLLHKHRQILEDGRFKVVIVENDSRPVQAELEAFPDIELIQPGSNLGYGRAANRVLRDTTSRHVLLLNPDVEISAEGVLALHDAAGRLEPAAAIVAPASRLEDYDATQASRDTGWVSGCAMLLNVELIREVGYFDENMFLYSEDTELCQRIGAKKMRITLCPAIHFAHDVGTSTPDSGLMERLRWWHFGWSNCYRLTKHGSPGWWKSPRAKMWRWRLRSCLSLTPTASRKWRSKADGAAAFLNGEKAFGANGEPREWQE